MQKFVEDGSGNVAVRSNLVVEDIEIGAVEIKNATTDQRATVDTTGALKVFDSVTNALIPAVWDYAALVQATLTDTWTFKTGGSGGSTVSTIVITYTSSAKTTIANVAKT
jgi:hypothetical protein